MIISDICYDKDNNQAFYTLSLNKEYEPQELKKFLDTCVKEVLQKISKEETDQQKDRALPTSIERPFYMDKGFIEEMIVERFGSKIIL
jgi:hypothetical protein